MNCRTARIEMVAARDGEIPVRRQRALDRHLDRCGACRAERVAFEGVLGALDRLTLEAEVPARLEQEVLRRVRLMADDEPAGSPAGSWLRMLAPAVATTGVVAIALVGVRSADLTPAPTTKTVAIAPARSAAQAAPVLARRTKTRVPADPPPALASRPDLFMNLPMLREFDKIQHFDAIAGMDDDDGPDGSSPSNG